MERKYRSEAMEPIYESALANFEIGAISEEQFREYERVCFVSEDSAALSVQRIRLEIPGLVYTSEG